MITIDRCKNEDIEHVMAFIDTHWARNHVLSASRALMDWQHREGETAGYNFLLARDGSDILGVLGYIPTRRYDPSLTANNTLWLALWKVRDDITVTGVGLRLLKTLTTIEENVAIGVVGTNPTHPPMYKALGYTTGTLGQYVTFSSDRPPSLAVVPNPSSRPTPLPGKAVFEPLDSASFADATKALDLGERENFLPAKSAAYFRTRYLDHPFYRYFVAAITIDGRVCGLIAVRPMTYENACALRVVDILASPDVFAECGSAIADLMVRYEAEHCDLWQYGLEASILSRAGFQPVDPDGDMIVPNYYEPFVRKNGTVLFAFKNKTKLPVIIFRGDGDQDRPNILKDAALE